MGIAENNIIEFRGVGLMENFMLWLMECARLVKVQRRTID